MENIKEGQLRVWHIPQVPGESFKVDVDSIKEARKVLDVLALYDIFQFSQHIKSDYSNAAGLEVYENGEWTEWYDNEGEDIDHTEME